MTKRIMGAALALTAALTLTGCDWESIRKGEGEWPAPTEAPAKPGPASSAK